MKLQKSTTLTPSSGPDAGDGSADWSECMAARFKKGPGVVECEPAGSHSTTPGPFLKRAAMHSDQSAEPSPASGPLLGVKVVDFCSFIAGSYGAMLLGDLGADVIKVEPLAGDAARA